MTESEIVQAMYEKIQATYDKFKAETDAVLEVDIAPPDFVEIKTRETYGQAYNKYLRVYSKVCHALSTAVLVPYQIADARVKVVQSPGVPSSVKSSFRENTEKVITSCRTYKEVLAPIKESLEATLRFFNSVNYTLFGPAYRDNL